MMLCQKNCVSLVLGYEKAYFDASQRKKEKLLSVKLIQLYLKTLQPSVCYKRRVVLSKTVLLHHNSA